MIIDHYFESLGTQTKFLPTNKLKKGTYTIELEVDDKKLSQEFVVTDL